MATDIQINPNELNDWELIVERFEPVPQGAAQIPKFNLDVQLNSDFIAVEVVTRIKRIIGSTLAIYLKFISLMSSI